MLADNDEEEDVATPTLPPTAVAADPGPDWWGILSLFVSVEKVVGVDAVGAS